MKYCVTNRSILADTELIQMSLQGNTHGPAESQITYYIEFKDI